MKGKLYGIGVGPGDPELLTLKAVKLLGEADMIVCPKGKKEEDSIALQIAKGHIHPNAEIKPLVFPMVYCKETLENHWKENISIISDALDRGKKVVFLTLGDALLYSTYIYIVKVLKEKDYSIETIPGITSFSAAASRVNLPLAEGDEALTILPLIKEKEKVERALTNNDNLVVLKVSHDPKGLASKLKAHGLEKSFVMISKCGHSDEQVTTDIKVLEEGRVPYLSTVIIKKGGKLRG
ncbi:precorrin-2 C20-methyltransferase /cobalt-factor II C20-methyltransferase [Natronincola peptidivorans]|uniref:Precorrin-2 C20-methyltransferase /cobalt-factor II C20-methyltransferase n=1 Tax=Natronincola peptidivorans TaxID=426128 RepID=A0A1I0CX35_9FIRM|nr:precorrin-2 C(20)-methyltransferase [Natronincola peptidivorans]SET23999.1 precorrin-2 C20-methyltransferase /cobalt-factor II C20-methyltransferase [Natronincola peptidivorans]